MNPQTGGKTPSVPESVIPTAKVTHFLHICK